MIKDFGRIHSFLCHWASSHVVSFVVALNKRVKIFSEYLAPWTERKSPPPQDRWRHSSIVPLVAGAVVVVLAIIVAGLFFDFIFFFLWPRSFSLLFDDDAVGRIAESSIVDGPLKYGDWQRRPQMHLIPRYRECVYSSCRKVQRHVIPVSDRS